MLNAREFNHSVDSNHQIDLSSVNSNHQIELSSVDSSHLIQVSSVDGSHSIDLSSVSDVIFKCFFQVLEVRTVLLEIKPRKVVKEHLQLKMMSIFKVRGPTYNTTRTLSRTADKLQRGARKLWLICSKNVASTG